MSIEFAPNEARRAHRFATPVWARLGELSFDVIDWSYDGFRIGGVDASTLPALQRPLSMDLVFDFPEGPREVTCRATLTWHADDEAGGRFEELPAEARALMQAHVALYAPQPLPGLAASQPGTGSSAKARYPGQAPRPPRLVELRTSPELDADDWDQRPSTSVVVLRTVGLVAATAVLALAIVALARAQIRITSVSAQVMGPTVTVPSPIAGTLDVVRVVEGQDVAVGDALFELDATRARARIEALQRLRGAHESSLAATEDQLASKNSAVAARRRAADARVAAPRAGLERADARLATAQAEVARLEPLARGGLLPSGQLTDARAGMAAAEGARAEAAARVDVAVAERRSVVDPAGDGGSTRAQSALVELELAMADAEAELAAAAVHARTPGRVQRLLATPGVTLRPGDPVLQLAAEGRRWVEARFAPDDAERLMPGQEVEVYLPAVNEGLAGRIAAIDAVEGAGRAAAVPVRIQVDDADTFEPGLGAIATIEAPMRFPWQRRR